MTTTQTSRETRVIRVTKGIPPELENNLAGTNLLREIVQKLQDQWGFLKLRVDTLQAGDRPDLQVRHHYTAGTWELTASRLGPQGDGVRPVLARMTQRWVDGQELPDAQAVIDEVLNWMTDPVDRT
jgi:hypothetical protein